MRWIIALAIGGLSGCSVGHYEYSSEAARRVDMTVTGIPTAYLAWVRWAPLSP